MRGMGRPLFRVLHNVIPMWISVLKLLKSAHKNLPSARSLKESRGGNLLAKAVGCGGDLKTESFRYNHERQPLRLLISCGRPDQMESFRGTNELAVALQPPSATSDSEGGSAAMDHYSTAPSSITSQSCSLVECGNVDEMAEDDGNFEETFVEIDQSITQPITDSRKKLGSGTVTSNLSACSAQILHRSDAFITYSQDPYCDFVSSISEMIVANQLTDQQELEDLFCCYLHLNNPKYHSIITLAFLEAMGLQVQHI